MNPQNNLSLLESLPQDLLGEVLSKVASSSVEDISNCLMVSKAIASSVEDHRVFKRLNIHRQARHPAITLWRYHNRLKKCIENGHPVAHYIEGIKQYFIFDNRRVGLLHLKKSAEGSYDTGIYLYGMLMLCSGNIAEGKTILSELGWEASKLRVDQAWKEVKISLRYVFVIMKPEYTAALRNNRPPPSCHMNDKKNRCPLCFHYKMMRKFIGFIR